MCMHVLVCEGVFVGMCRYSSVCLCLLVSVSVLMYLNVYTKGQACFLFSLLPTMLYIIKYL